MPARAEPDACPGVFAPHPAADGWVARIRLPGGAINSAQLRIVALIAEFFGDGSVHLTSRGNLQVRGLGDDLAPVILRLRAAGLLPSETHERVRNILATPLAGLPAAELDRAICDRPALAALPGRFLFALDDGRGDVAAEEPDVCWQAGRVLLAGEDAGVEDADPVRSLIAAAEAFLEVRSTEWRMRELPATARSVVARSLQRSHLRASGLAATLEPRHLVVAPLLGELTASAVRAVADAAQRAVVTPWRTILLIEPEWVPSEVPIDPALARVSACVGRPGCAKALADVRADTRAAWAEGRLPDGRVHVSGCARRCGAPRGEHIEFVAGERYL
ncbi:precorrin-3B synthase [Pseudonocardia sp. CA-107938]|uniref:precorrin-3B synthase n=1 Tax=Pseudonocardia sp. CA-107938 TaxID=3240021 RepID=UPI003D91A2A3